MNRSSKIALTLALALPVFALSTTSGLKSGLQPGEVLSPFEPTHVTGADKGTNTCPVCKYGDTPAVQIWVNNDTQENVAMIAASLNTAITTKGADKLKAFVVYVHKDKLQAEKCTCAEGKQDSCHLDNVAYTYLSTPQDDAVKSYKMNTDAKIKNTVLVYSHKKVIANFVNLTGDKKGLATLQAAVIKASEATK